MPKTPDVLEAASLALARTLDLDAVLETLLDCLAELVPYDSANVMLLEQPARLAARAVRGHETRRGGAAAARAVAFDPRTNPILARVLATQSSTRIDDTRAHPDWERVFGAEHVLNWMGVPLAAGGRVVGIFSVDKAVPGFFTDEHQRLAESLAPHAALAVHNAGLLAAERAAREEAERLQAAARALGSTLEPRQVFATILGELQALVPYDSAAVMELIDDRLRIVGCHGFPNPDDLLGVAFDVTADNPNRDVARTRAPLIVADAPARYPAFRAGPHAATPIRSWLGVPLLLGGRLVGMLSLDKREPGFFTAEHARLSDAFAVYAAAAMEHARLLAAARRELSERERADARQRVLLEEAPLALVAVDVSQRIVLVNREAERLFGYARAEILGAPLECLVPERLREAQGGPVARFIDEGRGRRAGWRLSGLRKDGSEFLLEASLGPLEIEGTPLVVAALLDVTEREAAEEELRRSEMRYRELFLAHPLPMWIYDLESLRFLAVNDAAVLASGWSREEFLGMGLRDLGPVDDLPQLDVRVAADPAGHGHERSAPWRHLTRDGRLREVEIASHDVRFDGRPARSVVMHDVTEQRVLEAQLRQSQKMDAVGQLAGGIAHDFNNMLGVMLGFAQLALKRLGPEDPVRRSVERIVEAAERSAGLTRQLLAFARKQTIAPRVLDVDRELAALVTMLERLVGEDVHVLLRPAAQGWRVKLDPGQLGQVLANLATNARDAIADVGTISIETSPATLDEAHCRQNPGSTPGDFVLLSFADSGSGMDRATRERVFEPFFTTKPEGGGTGLGLATVYGVVKQNGGFISVRSEPGQGTTFRIYLPRCHEDAETPAAPPPAAEGGRETVLLVEDEPQLLELTREALEDLGYTVLAAASPGDALLRAEQHAGRIDLLLTDVVMPGMNGRELHERIERLRPGLQALFVSGYPANAIAQRGVLEAGVAFLEKPFSLAALAAKVRAVLRP